MQLHSTELKQGIRLHCLTTKQFKTTTVSLYIHRPLLRGEATMNALLPMVLRRGCPAYPTSRELARRLNELYGASIDTGVRKKGDSQLLIFHASFANEKFLGQTEPIMQQMLHILDSLVLKQTAFSADYVAQEKENLKSQILAQMNDKRQYAMVRCVEEMCAHEPYGLNRLGYVEDIDPITPDTLFAHYKTAVLRSPMDVFVCGDIDPDEIASVFASLFHSVEVPSAQYPAVEAIKEVGQVKRITDTEQIAQGKLSMGLRTQLNITLENYPAFLLYNAVLGSGPYSKLFNNVREKLSLCYYASSTIDYLKGIMLINSGIEVSNFQRAYDEILEQMNQVNTGNITAQEMEAARLGMVNYIRSLADSSFATEDYYLGQFISGRTIDPDALIRRIGQVTKEQIVEVGNSMQLDTVYFLKGVE